MYFCYKMREKLKKQKIDEKRVHVIVKRHLAIKQQSRGKLPQCMGRATCSITRFVFFHFCNMFYKIGKRGKKNAIFTR